METKIVIIGRAKSSFGTSDTITSFEVVGEDLMGAIKAACVYFEDAAEAMWMKTIGWTSDSHSWEFVLAYNKETGEELTSAINEYDEYAAMKETE
jgi:hypothetical protein